MKGATALRFAAWIIAITLVALPVVGVLQGWFAAGRWPVRTLQVHAAFRHVSAAQIRAAVEPSLGAGFFALDLERVRDAVAALPWVSRVEVRKHWPDSLELTVYEIQPFARWNGDGLVGRYGRIFKVPDADRIGGLPQFNGPDDRVDDVLAFYREVQDDFAPFALHVSEVDLSARGSWSLVLSDGSRVVIGETDPEQRLQRFLSVMPILMRGRSGGFVYADLRYSNGFAVRWPATPAGSAPSDPKNTARAPSHATDRSA